MPSRGLPGFLRRTRRSDFDESDDDIEDDSAADNPQRQNGESVVAVASSVTSTKNDDVSLRGIERELEAKAAISTDGEPYRINSSATLDSYQGGGSGDGSTADDISALGASTAHFDSFSDASQSNLSSSKRMSYRESQFSKILSAPVVKLPELRKLAWNGITVRLLSPSGVRKLRASKIMSAHNTSIFFSLKIEAWPGNYY